MIRPKPTTINGRAVGQQPSSSSTSAANPPPRTDRPPIQRPRTNIQSSGKSAADDGGSAGSAGGRKISKQSAGGGRQSSRDTDDSAGGGGRPPRKTSDKQKPPLHPALQRRAVMMAANAEHPEGRKRSPHAMNAFRRLSRAEFPFKRASDKMHMDSVKKIMEKFERHSTIHGICHASLAPNKRWRRFWLAVFTVCFLILVIQVIYLVLKFFQYPKTVDLDLKFENAPFPSVTVCNLNPYKASVIGKDESVKATMNAFQNILDETGRSEGVAAALANSAAVRRRRRQLQKRARESKDFERRYLQVYAQCYCEISRLSAERRRGSCFAAYKGNVSLAFGVDSQLHNFHPTKCLCQLDWITKTLWPCFPYNTWKEHICTECVDQLGHCPMRFPPYHIVPPDRNQSARARSGRRRGKNGGANGRVGTTAAIESLDNGTDLCICHREYNHCVQNNINGEIPEVLPISDLEALNFRQHFVDSPKGEERREKWVTTTTTQAPDIAQAMGFEELKDEIAIKSQARENLMFAVEEKPVEERIKLSQPKEELILKCSFNQHDCNIKDDFKLYYDPTYGNCYSFNWDRNAHVTAHRAGANYGLRILVYANVSEYLPTSEAVGFRITVHDKWTVPFADAFGYNAPTGFMSSFGVRMKKFFRLEPPYGHCSEGGEKSEMYIYKGYSYSIEGCHRSCTQNEIIRICGCADPLYPVPNNAHSCKVSDPIARDCIKNTSRMLGDLIATGALENCKCHQPCRETAYEVTYSAARWPSGTTKLMECESTDNLCMEKYRTNAAMVQIFYEELNYETLSESVAYSLTSLFADLGGLTGLWIGISLVSILEVFQLIWFCLDFYRNKKKQQSATFREQKRSITSSSGASSLQKKPSSAKTPSNPSLGGRSNKSLKSTKSSLKGSVPEDIVPPVSVVIQEESERSSSSSSHKGSIRSRYLGPDEELPCTCLYGSRGQIVFMKPLCPFHGYMVRRCSVYSSNAEEDKEEEVEEKSSSSSDEAEKEGKEDEEGITREERRALQKEAKNEIDGKMNGRRHKDDEKDKSGGEKG